jgi:hypothetical protein
VSGALSSEDYHYDWKRVHVTSAPVQTKCRGERRYIGFPVIAFVPTGPSDETAKNRALFVRITGDPLLYRIRLRGDSAEVDETPVDAAARRVPSQLALPEPSVGTHPWSERIRIRGDYYRETNWNPSKGISVSNVRTDVRGAIVSMSMELRHGG